MTNYEFLLAKKSSGELKTLFALGLPVSLLQWIDIYAYHLEHPELSQFQVALHFKISKSVVWKSYHLLNEHIN